MLPVYDKVAAGGYAGLVSTVVIGVLAAFGVALPASAVAAIVTLLIFAAAYLKTETKAGAKIATVAEDVYKAIEAEGPVSKG